MFKTTSFSCEMRPSNPELTGTRKTSNSFLLQVESASLPLFLTGVFHQGCIQQNIQCFSDVALAKYIQHTLEYLQDSQGFNL